MKALITFALALAFSTAAIAANQADLSWYTNTSSDPANDNPTFVIYQGFEGGPRTAVASTTDKAITLTSGMAFGQRYCWDVTAKVGANESAHSAEACKTFPAAMPSVPLGVQVK